MNWLGQILGSGAEKLVSGVLSGVAKMKDAHLSGKEKELAEATLKNDIEKLVHVRDMAVLAQATKTIDSKAAFMIAEVQQGDGFTKRARPFVIYSGPIIVFLSIVMHYVGYFKGIEIPTPPILEWYLPAWAGYGAVYSWGRSQEKQGNKTQFTSLFKE